MHHKSHATTITPAKWRRAPQRLPSLPRCAILLCYAGRHDAGGFGGNGGGGFPSATYHGNGGGGFPSATILCRFTDIDPATAARPTTSRVTTSKRFMFFLQVDLTGGCLGTAPSRR